MAPAGARRQWPQPRRPSGGLHKGLRQALAQRRSSLHRRITDDGAGGMALAVGRQAGGAPGHGAVRIHTLLRSCMLQTVGA